MTAEMYHGRITRCAAHDRKTNVKTRPKTKCVACWMLYLSNRLETSLYQSDIDALIAFSNTFTKSIEDIEFNETAKEEE